MNRRPAVTLLEAIMAIFVMAIGLLALLTLFPLGAIQMAQSLKDQRTAEASINATSQWKAFNLNNDTSSIVLTIPAAQGGGTIFENPWPAATAAPGVPNLTTGSYVGASYPVLVDPACSAAGAQVVTTTTASLHALGPWLNTVGGVSVGIPRTTVSLLPSTTYGGQTPQWAQRWFYLQDDIIYTDNGLPDLTPGSVQREGRYSWAYMVRRPSASAPPPLDVTIVVYSGRLTGTNAVGTPYGETVYGDPGSPTTGTVYWGYSLASGTADAYTVTINWAGAPTKPELRRGKWILDSRMIDPTQPPPAPAPQGYFYRVVNVNEVSPTIMEIQVQQPLGGPLRGPNGTAGSTGPLVVVDSVSEVFEKGTNY
jgi:hypothetical protein